MTQDLAPFSPGLAVVARKKWQAVGSSAIILSWLYLNLPTLAWLGQSLRDLPLFNLLFLAAIGLLFAVQAVRYRHSLQLSAAAARPLPLCLLLGSAVLALGLRWWIALDQGPAVLFLLGSYGLAGLFLPPLLWRKGLPAAVALSIVIPFWLQFTTGLGFPARILTAKAVESLLHLWQITALSSEDIIVLDTGIAHVDLPCSGLKSLWMGTVLLLGMTWLEGRRIGPRWLLVCGANLALLVLANIARVLTLVLVIYVLRQPTLADTIHVPLGVMGFITVSLLSWGLLRWVPQERQSERVGREQAASLDSQILPGKATQTIARFLPPMLVIGFLGLSSLPQPPLTAANLPALTELNWPAPMQAESISLTTPEQEFFTSYQGVVAEKQRFRYPGLTGSIILVNSPTWQAHHSPELCYVGSGFHLDQMRQQQLTPTLTGRWLSLNQNSHAAVYWFQSPNRTTDSYMERFWADLTRQQQTWTMVSVLFDQPYSPEAPEVQDFLSTVQAKVAQIQAASDQV